MLQNQKVIQFTLRALPILVFFLIAVPWTYLSEKVILYFLLIFITRRIIRNYTRFQVNIVRRTKYNNALMFFGLFWTLGSLFYYAWGNRLVDREIIGFKLYGAVVTFCFDECDVDLVRFGLCNSTVEQSGSFGNDICIKILISEKEMLISGNGRPAYLLEKGKPYLFRDCGEDPEN